MSVNAQNITHISGSFFVSMIAATGMPKLDTGPQKSGRVSADDSVSATRSRKLRVEQR